MTATAAANATAASFHFTKFQVQRSILLVGLNNSYHLPIDTRQDEALLASVSGPNGTRIYGPDDGLQLIVNDIGGEEFAMIVKEGDDLYDIANSFADPACSLPSAEYGGVVWQVQGFASDKPDDAFTLSSGNDEAGIRNICAAMQAMLELPNKIRAYNDNLDAAEQAPDGNDYNALIDMLDA